MAIAYNNIFGNIDAQTVCFELKQYGFKAIDGELENDDSISTNFQRKMAACEIVAAVKGHPMMKSGWSAMAEQWLQKPGNDKAPAKTVSRALALVESAISSKKNHGASKSDLDDLKNRLMAKPKKRARFVAGTRKMLKETVFELNGSDKDNPQPDIEKSGEADVTICDLNVAASCQLIHYANVNELTVWLPSDKEEPHFEDALKILLLGWAGSLTRLEISIGESTLSKLAAAKFVCNSIDLIAGLKKLEHLTFNNVDITGKMFNTICGIPTLDVLDVGNSLLTRKDLKSVSKLKKIDVIEFTSCPKLDPEKDETYLKSLLPKARIASIN